MAWKTPSALPGSSWLTYVGPELAKRAEIDLEALAHRPWQHGVMSGFVHGGVMVQAGPEPVQGDLNRLKLPAAYIEAAHALSPWFADELKVDIEKCAKCGAPLLLRALVTAAETVTRFLRRLGEDPEPPPIAPARRPPFFTSPALRRKLGAVDGDSRAQMEMFGG